MKKKMKDMTGDGKITQRDVLKARGVPGMKKGGKCYAAGGFTKSADGVAQKGKTKAKQIVMKKGGSFPCRNSVHLTERVPGE